LEYDEIELRPKSKNAWRSLEQQRKSMKIVYDKVKIINLEERVVENTEKK